MPLQAGQLPDVLKILLVCSGNTCRSPMAECYLRALRPNWVVESAGTRARKGEPASRHAGRIMAKLGLDLGKHRSRPLSEVVLEDFDKVLVMTPLQQREIPVSSELLSSLRGEESPVPDPYGGTEAEYQSTFEAIRYYLDAFKESEQE